MEKIITSKNFTAEQKTEHDYSYFTDKISFSAN